MKMIAEVSLRERRLQPLLHVAQMGTRPWEGLELGGGVWDLPVPFRQP
jgi:hypothetical protein